MGQLEIDLKTAEMLAKVESPVEMRAPNGVFVGLFTPAATKPDFSELVITEEELKQIMAEEEYTYQEVLAHLETLK